ncbi:MAG: DNA polymerase IV [Candidatus Dormibacteria bacterium]
MAFVGGIPAPLVQMRLGTVNRTILHADLDAFFVSCELLRRPEFRGRPVVVGGGRESHPDRPRRPGRGVVAAASYEARQFGVVSALPLAQAVLRCPSLVVLPVDIGEYSRISALVFRVFADYTPLVEPGSLDEAYLDLTGTEALSGGGAAVARTIAARLLQELGLPCSVGVASTKVVAKVASDLRKPRGLVVVAPGEEEGFLAGLPVERLPGAGPKTTARLRLLGITTLGALAAAPTALLQAGLGNAADGLRLRARGVDRSPVVPPGLPKSLSSEETFPRDISARSELEGRIVELALRVARRLRQSDLTARAVSLKLRYADFRTEVRRRRLGEPTCEDGELARGAALLFTATWDEGQPVRLLGVGAEGLDPVRQLDLFQPQGSQGERLDRVLDGLRRRYGQAVIARGVPEHEPGRPLDWNQDHLRRLGAP